MPIYKYRCSECKDEYEIAQSILDKAMEKCLKCDGPVVRIIGKDISVSFKGPGFYINDSKKKKS